VSNYPGVSGPDPSTVPALAALLEHLQRRHNQAIDCALLYGSCLRNGDIFDGVLDVYLICQDYSSAYNNGTLTGANWLLPPNVFYAEVTHEGQTLRGKITVISRRDFSRGCSRSWFQSYIWGRFAQPTHIVYSRDQELREEIEASLLQAVNTLLFRTLPALPAQGSLQQLWAGALRLSYSTELRTESKERATELAAVFAEFYVQVSRQQTDSLAFPFAVYDDNHEPHYRSSVPTKNRQMARIAWPLRRLQGKLLSILRLVKALFTYDGGLDYIAWKLQRHSGQDVVIPPRVRRFPLVFMWSFFWKLYRQGFFK
jgi:hypothetical protein